MLQYFHIARHAYLHQVDVVVQKFHLVAQVHHLVGVVEHVAEHLAQVHHGLLCLGLVEGCQGIDVVQRVQQKVGVYLAAKVGQFGLTQRHLGFLALFLKFHPAVRHAQCGGERHSHRKVVETAEQHEKGKFCGRVVVRAVLMDNALRNPFLFVHTVHALGPKGETQCKKGYQHHVENPEKLAVVPLHKADGHHPVEVQVEHGQHRQRHHRTVKIGGKRDGLVGGGEHDGHEEEGPDNHQVYPVRVFQYAFLLVHCSKSFDSCKRCVIRSGWPQSGPDGPLSWRDTSRRTHRSGCTPQNSSRCSRAGCRWAIWPGC